MKNGILIIALSLGLMACGGESKKNNNDSAFGEFSSGIKGVEEQPSLTSADVSEGDSLTLNTNHNGNIEDYNLVMLNFTLEQDTQVALVLSSEAENLELKVSGNDLYRDSFLDGSNELIVFDALAGENYLVTLFSLEGRGAFQLKFVEANRASAGLSADEYLVDLSYTGFKVCSENGEPEVESNYSGPGQHIINWKSGYFSNSDGSDRENFKSVAGNAFTLSGTRSGTDEDGSFTSQFTATFNANFNTGKVTGSTSGTFNDVHNDYTYDCKYTDAMTGGILL
jgi:hypothetical protein